MGQTQSSNRPNKVHFADADEPGNNEAASDEKQVEPQQSQPDGDNKDTTDAVTAAQQSIPEKPAEVGTEGTQIEG